MRAQGTWSGSPGMAASRSRAAAPEKYIPLIIVQTCRRSSRAGQGEQGKGKCVDSVAAAASLGGGSNCDPPCAKRLFAQSAVLPLPRICCKSRSSTCWCAKVCPRGRGLMVPGQAAAARALACKSAQSLQRARWQGRRDGAGVSRLDRICVLAAGVPALLPPPRHHW